MAKKAEFNTSFGGCPIPCHGAGNERRVVHFREKVVRCIARSGGTSATTGTRLGGARLFEMITRTGIDVSRWGFGQRRNTQGTDEHKSVRPPYTTESIVQRGGAAGVSAIEFVTRLRRHGDAAALDPFLRQMGAPNTSASTALRQFGRRQTQRSATDRALRSCGGGGIPELSPTIGAAWSAVLSSRRQHNCRSQRRRKAVRSCCRRCRTGRISYPSSRRANTARRRLRTRFV